MLFSWSSKGITGKCPSPSSRQGETGKKAVFSTALWRWETTTYYNRAYWKYIFFSNCSSDGLPWLGLFIGYFFGISRKKASAVFYDAPPKIAQLWRQPTESRKNIYLQYVIDILSRQKQSHPITEPNISTIQYINHIVWQGVSFLLFPKAIALRGQLAPSLQSTFRQIMLRLDPPGKSV